MRRALRAGRIVYRIRRLARGRVRSFLSAANITLFLLIESLTQ